MINHMGELDGIKVPVHCILMNTDPYAMLLHRRREIASEMGDLRERLSALEAEDQELASAEKVLARFGVTQPDLMMRHSDGSTTLVEIKTSGKPEGTPTTPNMIIALLKEAMAHNKPGLEPKEMQMAIARRWWPSVKSEDVGPTAWRMWKDGRLSKEGPLYYLPTTHGTNEEKEAVGFPWEKPAASE
ncbi:hypothetical protein OZ411_27080 [Bradyrhizobium sp. Arg237L]|uniref:hypothetical protein n=1 Tax=Bradyrhizobium sp. Arg237L TaxID=3003352 RepID=UPI00249E3039|nr:hypothetical protein [Bradyrhizobium sp. Arg237L]MDI4236484.1 hypothetical protein [Bradyrhizobium sp. Arg237L]